MGTSQAGQQRSAAVEMAVGQFTPIRSGLASGAFWRPHYPIHDVRLLARRPPVWKQLNSAPSLLTGQGPLARDGQLAQLEALLFVADEPLPLRRLTALLRHGSAEDVRRLLRRLQSLYEQDRSPFHLVELA